MIIHVPWSFLLLPFTVIFISACEVQERKTEEVPLEPAPGVENELPEFSARLITLPEPNHYQVSLKWQAPELSIVRAIVLRREDLKSHLKTQFILAPRHKEFLDESMEPGREYRYELALLGDAPLSVKAHTQITIPVDFEVSGTMGRSGLPPVHRLFFKEGSRLVMNGSRVELAVGEIISDGGTIESFAEGQTAADGTPGRSGGTIIIRAKGGKGILHVVARGENGGKGAIGAASTQIGAKGNRGNDGACGRDDEGWRCTEVTREYLDRVRPQAQRAGPEGETARKYLEHFHCRVQTANGGQGGQGVIGGKGGRGAPGGDSGTLYVQIEAANELTVKPTIIGGRGGLGGEGGPGGPGGPGSDPGTPDHLGLCRVASPGPQGIAGPRGPQGDSGSNGQAQPYCVRLSSSGYGDCDKFITREGKNP